MTSISYAGVLDDLDRRLLAELHANPRVSVTTLARLVGGSVPAVTDRLQRLERDGVIVGFAMVVDPVALGLPVSAFARIEPTPGHLPKIAELAAALPEVTECHRITGEDGYLLRIHASSIAALEDTLDQFVLYGRTATSIVVSTPVPPRALPVA